MSLLLRYSDPRGVEEPAVLTSLGSNVRLGQVALQLSAEVGQTAISTIEVEDPGGIWTFNGLRAFDVRETSAGSNNTMIGRFAIQDRTVGRSPERGLITGTDRLWSMDLADYNWHLGKRVLVDSDSNRPAETAGDRIRWLLTSAAHVALNDYGHVSYPTTQMDACDYRLQRPIDVLSDCAVESGWNFWVDVNEAHGTPELFFMNPDASTYFAAISVSNVLADVDSTVCFAPFEDAVLHRSPTRLAYGVAVAFGGSGGHVYVRNDVIAQQYAAQDQTAPMSNVKTAARARRIATKFLNDNDEESDRLVFTIRVPAAQVNDVRHGQAMSVRFAHLPGYETATVVRVLRRTVVQEEPDSDYYRLTLEAVPCAATAPYTGTAFAALLGSDHNTSTTVEWWNEGDAPPGGWFVEPLSGPFTIMPVDGSGFYTAIRCDAAMVIRIDVHANIQFATASAGSITTSVVLNRSGADVVLDTDVFSWPAGPAFYNHDALFDLRDQEVQPGDQIIVRTTSATDVYNATGANTTHIRVGRGTTVMNSGTFSWTGP